MIDQTHCGCAQPCSCSSLKLTRLQNIEALQQAGAMQLLRPLLLDNVPRCVCRRALLTGHCLLHHVDAADM